MANYWRKVDVYNHDWFVGTFIADYSNKKDLISEINKKYGYGNWTRYNID